MDDTTINGSRPDPDKKDWADYADTTLAHERGTQGNAQLAAEGRTLPAGRPARRKSETARAKPAPERATAGPQRGETATDLAALTVKDLKARAAEAGVEGYASMNKADLVTALGGA